MIDEIKNVPVIEEAPITTRFNYSVPPVLETNINLETIKTARLIAVPENQYNELLGIVDMCTAERVEYAALKTDADRILYMARKLKLVD